MCAVCGRVLTGLESRASPVGRMNTWRDVEHAHICLMSREGNCGRNHVKTLVLLKKQ